MHNKYMECMYVYGFFSPRNASNVKNEARAEKNVKLRGWERERETQSRMFVCWERS